MCAERASAWRLACGALLVNEDDDDDDDVDDDKAEEKRSGWALAWSWRNSARRRFVSMEKDPAGGGPDERVCGKRS